MLLLQSAHCLSGYLNWQQPKLETEVIDDRQKAVKIQQKSFGELEPDTAFGT